MGKRCIYLQCRDCHPLLCTQQSLPGISTLLFSLTKAGTSSSSSRTQAFSLRHWCPSHRATPAFYLCACDSVFDWEWMWKVPISFPCMSTTNMCVNAPWALMAETWAIKARAQSNQLCAVPPWHWLCQACVPHYKQAERPPPNPQSGESRPHMNQDM